MNVGVGRLVVVQCAGERHQDGGTADGHQFGHRAGAGAGNHQMGFGHAPGQVGEECLQLGADLGIAIDLAYLFDVFGAALLHHRQAHFHVMRQAGQGGGHDLAQGAGALAAAEDQQAQRPAGFRHIIRCGPQRLDFRTQGIAGQHDLGFIRGREAGDGERGRHQPAGT